MLSENLTGTLAFLIESLILNAGITASCYVSAGVAQDFIEILQPKNTSVWVANGKTRRVAFAYDEGEIDKWLFEILDKKGKAVYAYPEDIIIPLVRGGKSVYEKNLVVPESLKSDKYQL